MLIETRLDPAPSAPGIARRQIVKLGEVMPEEQYETLRLLVTEVLTNAVQHASTPKPRTIGLLIDLSDERVRVEVEDHGPGFEPDIPEVDPMAEGRRGLLLVRELSDRWGVKKTNRNVVWFEVDLSDSNKRSDHAYP